MTKEACTEGIPQSKKAETLGADRIELCAALEVGGTTPSREIIGTLQKELNIPIRVMIRPRGGDFVYSEEELQQMKKEIGMCKEIGVEGVVFGVLNPDDTLNLEVIKELTALSQPLKVVIHKAIDQTPDVVKAFRELLKMDRITTVLTSGGAPTAKEGAGNIKKMIKLSKGRIEVMPGGKVDFENLQELHGEIGAGAYHGKRIVGELYI